MGTTLTGTTPQDTYDSLIKVTDNGPLSGTLKALSDGLGNDSTLSLSTTAASIAGTLAVTGNATFDTTTMFVDAANNRVGILTASPTEPLHVEGNIMLAYGSSLKAANATYKTLIETGYNGSSDFVSLYTAGNNAANATAKITMLASGNVGIGTGAPFYKQQVNTSSTGNIVAAGFVNTSSANNTTKASSISLLLSDTVGNLKDAAYLRGYAGDANVLTGGLAIDVRKVDGTPTEIARFTPDGLTFNGDTAAANALDDYEEGTWTMGISFGGGSTGVTTSNFTGTYTKIGRQVTVNGYLALTSKGSSTGQARITGLPFTIGATSPFFSTASVWMFEVSFANQFQAYGERNSTEIVLSEITEAGAYTILDNSNFANNSEIMVSLTYFV